MRIFTLLLLFIWVSSCSTNQNDGEDDGYDYVDTPITAQDMPMDDNAEAIDTEVTFKWWNPLTWGAKSSDEDLEAEVDNPLEAETNLALEGEETVATFNLDENAINAEDQLKKAEEKERLRNARIDIHLDFKSNLVYDYYGLPLLLIRMPDDWHRINKGETSVFIKDEKPKDTPDQGQVYENANANELLPTKPNEADKYLISAVPTYKSNITRSIDLSNLHKTLLADLVEKTKGNKSTLILFFINSTSIQDWEDTSSPMEKTIYTQYVMSYLYKNILNVKIEKRFVKEIPSDEIFLVALNYEGSLDKNMYNAPRSSVAQWLATYRDLEMQRVRQDAQNKKDIEALISGSTSLNVRTSNPPAATTNNQPPAAPRR